MSSGQTKPENNQFMEKEIHEFTQMVWKSFLNLDIKQKGVPAIAPEDEPARCAVQISGSWNGWFVMDLPAKLAQKAAQSFFSTENPSPDQLEETMKELANMVGGNIKSLLPQPSTLMFPIVSLDGPALHFPDAHIKTDVGFQCQDTSFNIRLLEYPPN